MLGIHMLFCLTTLFILFSVYHEKMKMKVAQLCLALCDSMDCTVHGILQARILEWVAMPSSRGSSQPRDRTQVSLIAGDSLSAEPQIMLPPKRISCRHTASGMYSKDWIITCVPSFSQQLFTKYSPVYQKIYS